MKITWRAFVHPRIKWNTSAVIFPSHPDLKSGVVSYTHRNFYILNLSNSYSCCTDLNKNFQFVDITQWCDVFNNRTVLWRHLSVNFVGSRTSTEFSLISTISTVRLIHKKAYIYFALSGSQPKRFTYKCRIINKCWAYIIIHIDFYPLDYIN